MVNTNKVSNTERLANELQTFINNLIDKHCDELNSYMKNIDEFLRKSDTIDDQRLEMYILEIPSIIYQVICNTENFITKEAIAKMIEKDKANKIKSEAGGTVAQKQAAADELSQEEAVIHLMYTNINKGINKRIDCANEMLNSLKKVMSRRMTEAELSNNKFAGRRRNE